MASEVPAELTSDQTLEALESAINLHFKTLWVESGQGTTSDYIPDWLVVIHFQDLTVEDDGPVSAGYSMETRRRMAPHAIRGLLEEGLDWLAEQRMREDDEDRR